MEEKVFMSNKISLELLKQLKDAEIELMTLHSVKQELIDYKQRISIYIPIKEDIIDKKLSDFLNNYPDRKKLKIMFMRESEGVY